MSNIQDRIVNAINKYNNKPMNLKDLYGRAKVKKLESAEFRTVIQEMENKGQLIKEGNSVYLSKKPIQNTKGLEEAIITKLSTTFGFARLQETQKEIFIPGKFMMGTMPGDKVWVRVNKAINSKDLDDGRVMSIIEHGDVDITGVAVKDRNYWLISADKGIRSPIMLDTKTVQNIQEGDKIIAKISSRGARHEGHRASLISSFGTSNKAQNCVDAILASNRVTADFPEEISDLAQKIAESGIHPKEIEVREDLRNERIFTIDSAYSKDMDDAINIQKTSYGYRLGVHIADVSYYVTPSSTLDIEAFKRGTSIYYADKVIPMLPTYLSNDICSLNPKIDRLAFTVFIDLSDDGIMKSFEFKKTVINSVVKGVYSEVNEIITGTANDEIKEKYKDLTKDIFLMKELADILRKNRKTRGALDLESSESRIVLDENDCAVDVVGRETGISENIVEEFMLTANEAAAEFGLKYKLPFLFRVHEQPTALKLQTLKELLDSVGIPSKDIEEGVTQTRLAQVLNTSRNTPYHRIVNNTLLRSMAKAKYSHENIGHYGLVLNNYSHFTSPIRRYPDLVIHRVMSSMLINMRRDNIEKRFRTFVPTAAQTASAAEIKAMTIERDCENCYKAEYMSQFINQEFEGVVTSAVSHGIYVELDNSVEGLVRVDFMPTGYEFDGKMKYVKGSNEHIIAVGDKIKVKVSGTDVSAGQVDFSII